MWHAVSMIDQSSEAGLRLKSSSERSRVRAWNSAGAPSSFDRMSHRRLMACIWLRWARSFPTAWRCKSCSVARGPSVSCVPLRCHGLDDRGYGVCHQDGVELHRHRPRRRRMRHRSHLLHRVLVYCRRSIRLLSARLSSRSIPLGLLRRGRDADIDGVDLTQSVERLVEILPSTHR